MTRQQLVQIDLNEVMSANELHSTLRDALGFPGWYGCNWDAFWDAITGLVEMPVHLRISGWDALCKRLPKDAELMQKCFEEQSLEFPSLAPNVEFD
jgi:ribonuclease inhibitor